MLYRKKFVHERTHTVHLSLYVRLHKIKTSTLYALTFTSVPSSFQSKVHCLLRNNRKI